MDKYFMNYRIKSIILPLSFIILSNNSCIRKNTIIANTSFNEAYLGSWEWIKSKGGFDGRTITPISEDYNQTLVLSYTGIFKWYRNDSLILYSHYDIISQFSPNDGRSIDILILKDYDNSIRYRISLSNNDILILYDQMMDGFIHTYSRKN
jgi:hypothetical protein